MERGRGRGGGGGGRPPPPPPPRPRAHGSPQRDLWAFFQEHEASHCASGRGRDMAPPCRLRRAAGAGSGSVRGIRWKREPRQLREVKRGPG
jgi:hypothetical protein